jgi:hypothetical protein
LKRRQAIRERVLRGLALNRIPGLHFPGNFLDVSFDRVGRKGVRLSLDPGPWCTDAAGEADLAALAMLADLALGASMRAAFARNAYRHRQPEPAVHRCAAPRAAARAG